jgi:hypothetical protein
MGYEQKAGQDKQQARAAAFGEIAQALVRIMLPGEKVDVDVPVNAGLIVPGQANGVVQITFFRAANKLQITGR